MTKHRVTITVEIPDNKECLHNEDIAEYIMAAVRSWYGSYSPGNPLKVLRDAKWKARYLLNGKTKCMNNAFQIDKET